MGNHLIKTGSVGEDEKSSGAGWRRWLHNSVNVQSLRTLGRQLLPLVMTTLAKSKSFPNTLTLIFKNNNNNSSTCLG